MHSTHKTNNRESLIWKFTKNTCTQKVQMKIFRKLHGLQQYTFVYSELKHGCTEYRKRFKFAVPLGIYGILNITGTRYTFLLLQDVAAYRFSHNCVGSAVILLCSGSSLVRQDWKTQRLYYFIVANLLILKCCPLCNHCCRKP